MTLDDLFKHASNLQNLKNAFEGKIPKVKPKTFWEQLASEIGVRLTGGRYLPMAARIGWSALIVLSVAFFSRSMVWLGVVSGLVLLIGAGKQFVWNARYVPYSRSQSGVEFVGYVSGVAMAWVLVIVRALIG
jgi:hypothetical protein